jgi:hypothetical protein
MENYISSEHAAKYEYSRSLINPFESFGAKCPSAIPIDSATAHVEYNIDFNPNSSGRFLIIADPMRNELTINNDAALTGLSAVGTPTTVPLSQDNTVIDMYRLVSYGLKLTYQGDLQTHKGYVVSATTSNLSAEDFRIFSNIENLHTKVRSVPLEGVNIKYVPVDPDQLDFKANSVYTGNTHSSIGKQVLIIYGTNLPTTASFRLDIVRNIEFVSRPGLREYITHTCGQTFSIHSVSLDEARAAQISTGY